MAKKYYPKKPSPIPLTQAALDEAKQKVEKLSTYREEVLVRLQTAREMGDLSENGAYTAARFELGDTDRKLRHYRRLVMFGVVPEKKVGGVIGFGSQVTLDLDGKEITYTLVSRYEADPTKQKLSVDSPIGFALLDKSEGNEVTIETPRGKRIYKILKVY
jgi:transcription elongation factor GreA